jgi:hypothetical protein
VEPPPQSGDLNQLPQLYWHHQGIRVRRRIRYLLSSIPSTSRGHHLRSRSPQLGRRARTHRSPRTRQAVCRAFERPHRCNQLGTLRCKTYLSHRYKALQLCTSRQTSRWSSAVILIPTARRGDFGTPRLTLRPVIVVSCLSSADRPLIDQGMTTSARG